MGPMGELFIDTPPLALLVDTCVRYQGKKKKKKNKGLIWDISKENKFFFFKKKGGMTKK